MADQPQAKNAPEQSSQEAPMPSAEQQAPETQPSEEASSSPRGPEGESQTEKSVEDLKLSEDTTSRTSEQFDKLKKQLAEEKGKRAQYERMFAQTAPQAQPAQQTSQGPSWFNPDTGEVIVDSLQGELSQKDQQISQLRSTVQGLVAQNDARQTQAAYKKYPQLDPNRNDFNEELHNAVVGYLANSYAAGKTPTMRQAADTILNLNKTDVKKAQKEGAKQAMEKLTPKEEASVETSGRSDRRQEVQVSQEELVRATRGGEGISTRDSNLAIAERLKNIPPVGR